jgi:hypothetical protein
MQPVSSERLGWEYRQAHEAKERIPRFHCRPAALRVTPES